MSWHIEAALLRRYADGELDRANASSVEAHLLGCGECRALTTTEVEPARLVRIWHAVEAEIDAPRAGVIERLLRRCGVRDHVARSIAATPSLQASWFTAIAVTLAWALIAAHESESGIVVFLVVAPLIPLAGVAFAFGPGIDPAYEVGVASPMRGLSLLLIRAGTVLVVSTAVVGAASSLLPGIGWRAAAWLLPALGMALATLALSTWTDPLRAAGLVAVGWIGATVGTAMSSRGVPVLDRVLAFEPGGQAAFVVVIAGAAAVLVARSGRFDLGRQS